MSEKITAIRFKIGDAEMTAKGRCAWALAQLVAAGQEGCTPIDRPAPRWSDYIFKLRGQGVPVETVTEMHGGTYAGHHARYRLSVPVEILEVQEAA